MSKLRTDLVAKELKKRLTQAQVQKQFKLEDYCFDKQLAFISDPSRFKTAVCSRRAGKTIACAADLLHTAMARPGDVAYITLSRRNAKRIIWRELLKLNKDYAINAKIDATELTLKIGRAHV